MLTKIDKHFRITQARKQLTGNIRTAITALDPDGLIFDHMDQADSKVEAMTDKEVVATLQEDGLIWGGGFWMRKNAL